MLEERFMNTEAETIQIRTQGTCCRVIQISILENKIKNVQFMGGCHGNTQGIAKLVEDMEIDTVIEKLKGIQCGDKPTSCPDQLAQGLILYKQSKQNAKV